MFPSVLLPRNIIIEVHLRVKNSLKNGIKQKHWGGTGSFVGNICMRHGKYSVIIVYGMDLSHLSTFTYKNFNNFESHDQIFNTWLIDCKEYSQYFYINVEDAFYSKSTTVWKDLIGWYHSDMTIAVNRPMSFLMEFSIFAHISLRVNDSEVYLVSYGDILHII